MSISGIIGLLALIGLLWLGNKKARGKGKRLKAKGVAQVRQLKADSSKLKAQEAERMRHGGTGKPQGA